jgi:APA family basic amino acid/polyamine antiporter
MRDPQTVSLRVIFAIIYATSISAVYFGLGVVAHHAQGLTPEVFIFAGFFFQLTAMTYAEGAARHPERGGSASFARHAFNELVSFIAGWSIVLDYTILVAVTALAAPAYLAIFWPALSHGTPHVIAALVVVALVTIDNLFGVSARSLRRRMLVAFADLAVQVAVVILGLILVFHATHLTHTVHFGSSPSVSDLAFALPVGVIAFAGLESASGLAAEVMATPQQVKRLVAYSSAAIVIVYVGIAAVGIAALPVHGGFTALGSEHINAPLLGIAEAFHPKALADVLKYAVGVTGALGLAAAGAAAMLGVSRVGYSMATHRQIPSGLGRLSAKRNTPWLVIVLAALAAAAMVIPANLEALIGIYAFGALLAFTIAHLSVIVMRFREPDRGDEDGSYRVPWSVSFRGVKLPLPTLLGAVLSAAGWVSLLIYHHGARYVGLGWTVFGIALYVAYRKYEGKSVLRRVTIPERALRHEDVDPEFGSILVPIFGTKLDDDIVQTAGRLAGESRDELNEKGATIEAIWIFEIPMSLPLDAPLPEAQVERARQALKRAREVGEEYEGVEVATAIVRARRTGQKIVQEAKRRGVEIIVLGAEEPSGIRGGSRLGSSSGPLENFVSVVTKYVITKAPCRVILTAPPLNRDAPLADPVSTAGSTRG